MGDYYNYEIEDLKIIDAVGSTSPSVTLFSVEAASLKKYHSGQKKPGSKCKRFRNFVYNKEDKTACNRRGKHWGALLFYYSFFLSLLAILFLCYLYGIFRVVGKHSRLAPPLKKIAELKNPTFAFVPTKPEILPEPIIWYEFSGKDEKKNRRSTIYVQEIKEFYKQQVYRCASLKMRYENCLVQEQHYGPCGKAPFGYDEQKPCIFIKLNTMDDWSPTPIAKSHYKIPKTLPAELTKDAEKFNKTLCVFCQGKTNFDKEHLGKIKYHPGPCFNDIFFPYGEGPTNVNAILALQLINPDPGLLLNLRCQLFGYTIDGSKHYDQSIYVYVGSK